MISKQEYDTRMKKMAEFMKNNPLPEKLTFNTEGRITESSKKTPEQRIQEMKELQEVIEYWAANEGL